MVRHVCFYVVMILLIAIAIPIAAAASDLTGADFAGNIAVTNTGTAATNVSTVFAMDNESLFSVYNVDRDFDYVAVMSIAGTDSKFSPGGYEDDKWQIFEPSIDEDKTNYELLYVGHSDLAAIKYYFTGSTGMVVLDNSTIELGSYGSVELSGFINTTAGSGNIANKPGAMITGIGTSTNGQIYSSIYNVWPVIAATNTSTSASGTSHAVNLPASIASGDLLIIFGRFVNGVGAAVVTPPAGWTQLYTSGNIGTYMTVVAFYKVATGAEGATATVTTNIATTGVHDSYRISAGTYSNLLTVGAGASSADPPSATAQYSTVANCLYIAHIGINGGTVSAYPPGYNLGQLGSGATSGVASKWLNASSANPEAFTISAGTPWTNTICIYPGGTSLLATGMAPAEYDVLTDITETMLKSEGFEGGNDGDSVATLGGTVTWSVTAAGTSRAEIDTAQFYAGTRSGRLYRDGANNPSASFVQTGGDTYIIESRVRKDADSSFGIQHGNGTKYITVVLEADEDIVFLDSGSAYVDTGANVAINTWYLVGIANINFTAGTYDIYLDNSLIYRGATMTPGASIANIIYFINTAGTSEAWIDDVEVYTTKYSLNIDGVEKDSEYIASGVPNNTQSYTIGDDDATPYIEYPEIKVGGTQSGYWAWEYPDTMSSTLTNGTGTATGSPITLAEGANTVTVTAAGNFVINNAFGWGCKAESNGATVTSSPVWCPSPATRGTTQNTTITVTGTGTITVTLYQVFHDQSANTNDGIPSFRTTSSDADVSALISSFAPIEVAVPPEFQIEDTTIFYSENSSVSGQFTTGGVDMGGPAGFALINDIANAGGVPNIWLFGIIAMCLIVGGHFFFMWMQRRYGFRSMLPLFFTGLTILGLFIALGGTVKVFDFWMVFFYVLLFVCVMVMSRHTEVGGSVSTHGIIGFAAQSWLGLTLINQTLEGTFAGAEVASWTNNFAFTQDFKLFGLFDMPVLNLQFFTEGIPSLIRWDYSFFGGNAQMFQYLLYVLTAVVAFVLFGLMIGLLYNFFQGR